MPPENETPSQDGSTQTPAGQPDDVNQKINSVVSAHLKRFIEKQLPSVLEAQLGAALKPLQEKLSAPPPAPPAEENLSGKAKATAELAALQKQFDEMKAIAEKNEKSRIETEQRARQERLMSELRSEVSKHTAPAYVDVLTHYLAHGSKTVRPSEDGNTYVYLPGKNAFGEIEEQAYPLTEGLATYFRSEAGKAFVQAPQAATASHKPSGNTLIPHVGSHVDASKLDSDQSKLAAALALIGNQNR